MVDVEPLKIGDTISSVSGELDTTGSHVEHTHRIPNYKDWPLVSEHKDLEVAITAALSAGRELFKGFYSQFEYSYKKDRSELTPFDARSENIARTTVNNAFPDAKILGEEAGRVVTKLDGSQWTPSEHCVIAASQTIYDEVFKVVNS